MRLAALLCCVMVIGGCAKKKDKDGLCLGIDSCKLDPSYIYIDLQITYDDSKQCGVDVPWSECFADYIIQNPVDHTDDYYRSKYGLILTEGVRDDAQKHLLGTI